MQRIYTENNAKNFMKYGEKMVINSLKNVHLESFRTNNNIYNSSRSFYDL